MPRANHIHDAADEPGRAPDPFLLEPPPGTYDQMPAEAAARRRLEATLRRVFAAWGYQEVITPTFEQDAVVLRGEGAESARRLYRFVDREGQVLALRPEWTTPIARLVAARMARMPPPLRLAYVGNVFRYDRLRPDNPREFGQAGVELIGAGAGAADAEVMALALEACREAGIEDARLELGHAGYVQALVQRVPGLGRQEAVRQALIRRDLVALEQETAAPEVPAEVGTALRELVTQARGGAEVLGRLGHVVDRDPGLAGSPQAREASRSLHEVWHHLEALGVADRVSVDLSLVKDFTYYTGIVFEVYAPDASFSLATGGRYDGLLRQFGLEWPATGFGASVDRLLGVQARRRREPWRPAPAHAWIVDAGADGVAWAIAAGLRRRGLRVAVEVLGRSWPAAVEAAGAHGVRWLVRPVARSAGASRAIEQIEVLAVAGPEAVWSGMTLDAFARQALGPAEATPAQ